MSPRSDGGQDSGIDAGPSDAAAIDAASPRGDQPEWPEAELEIELPYGGAAVSRLLIVEAEPSALDVHLNIDTTGSMGDAIDELQSALRTDIIQRLRARVADVAFGVSRFADFPVDPFGEPGSEPDRVAADQPFRLLSPITTNYARVISAVAKLDQPLDHGGDIREASAEALYQIATGAGYSVGTRRYIERKPSAAAVGGGTIGGVGFRSSALHVVLHVADSPTHLPDEYELGDLPGTHSLDDASAALRAIGARVVSIIPTVCDDQANAELKAECRASYPYAPARRQLSALAVSSGAVLAAESGSCPTGIQQRKLPAYEGRCPLVYDARGDGSGLSRTLGDAVIALLEEVRFGEVHIEAGSDGLGFVRAIQAESVPQPSGVPQPGLRDRLPAAAPDGVPDSFSDVDRRSQLGFRVTLRNDRIAPSDIPQRFRVSLRVLADGILLQDRVLRVVVPNGETPGHVTAPEPDLDAGQ